MSESFKPPYDHTGETIKINLYLGYAVFLVAIAYWIWPSDPRWWGFYGLAILLCCSAFGLVLNALRSMIKLKKAVDKWKAIQSLGNAPKNAKMASKSDLQNKGMN